MREFEMEPRMVQFKNHLITEEKSSATIEKYQRDVGVFFRFMRARDGLNKEAVIAYKEALVKMYAVSSVNSMLASVNSFLNFLGLGQLRVKPLKTQRRIFCSTDTELTREDYYALLDAAQRLKKERLWLLLQTLCSTGIRVGELSSITVEAARRRRCTVTCKGKSRLVFLPKRLCERLLRYAQAKRISSGSIFVTKNGSLLDRSNIWQEMKRLCGPAGVSPKKVFPHNLRHLFARTFYSKEKDLARLADVLGHSSVETTRIYILTSGDEQERQIGGLGLVAS